MRKIIVFLSISAFAVVSLLSCQKEDRSISQNAQDNAQHVQPMVAEVPISIGVGIRLYRPRYNCLRGLSLCIGKKKHVASVYAEPSLFMSGETVGDTSIRLADANISLNADKTIMTIQFQSDFDKSDGQTFTIDDGLNTFDLDSEVLSDLGVSSITMASGSYDLTDLDVANKKYGTLTIPVTTK